MFKKGKKKQENKVAIDFNDLGDSKENAGEAENGESTNLREEIAKIKSKGKSKPTAAVSFDEETADDDFVHQKKPLFNTETMNTEPEETKAPLPQPADVKKYNRDYLEELRKQNVQRNESAREMMQNIQTLADLGHMEEEIIENQAAEKMEEDGADFEEDEDQMDEAQLREIEKAKEYRERKRKQEAGDYISLQNNEREQEVGPSYNKDRALQNIFKDEGQSREKRQFYQEMEDEESDEEFKKHEASMIKRNVNTKAMKNINKFVRNTYGQGDDEPKEKEALKMLTYEVDLDYVMRCVTESLKTDEAKFSDNIEKAEKVEKLIAVSENNIQNYQREYDQNAASLEMFQDVADYMNDISDCLGEKNGEIEEGENVLRQLEENYANIRFTRYQLDISDQLEENGGQPIEFYDDNLNHKRNTEKNFRRIRRFENDRPLQVGGKIEYILEGINNQETLTLRRDEDLTNLKVDKAALYLAGKDIFKDVVEEYTNIGIIVSRFYELKDKYVAEEPKVLDWLTEALVPFATVDLIGYDPLGYTDVEHEFHKKIEFTELPFFKELSNLQQSYESDSQKDIQDKNAFMKKLIFYIQEKCVKKRLKEIIEFHWDPLSTEETKNLAAALNLFIDVYYRPNKTKQHLETLQDLLLSVTKKLKDYLNILIFPPRADTKFGYDMIVLCTKFIVNIISLKGILPDRHIIQIGISTVFFTTMFEAIKNFSEYEQVILISKILEIIPANIISSEDAKSNFESLKLHLNKVVPYVTGKSASFNIPEKYTETVNQALSHLGQTLKLNF